MQDHGLFAYSPPPSLEVLYRWLDEHDIHRSDALAVVESPESGWGVQATRDVELGDIWTYPSSLRPIELIHGSSLSDTQNSTPVRSNDIAPTAHTSQNHINHFPYDLLPRFGRTSRVTTWKGLALLGLSASFTEGDGEVTCHVGS